MPSVTHALVTGASAGIGAAFARELAARGHALVLVARRADRLEALATELRARHGVAVECIACDLADPHTPQFLLDQTTRRGISVDMLINNAGYGVTGSLVSREWRTHEHFIEVMISAPTALCHRFIPAMRERGYGRIVNVASIAGKEGNPMAGAYSASKAAVIAMTKAIGKDLARTGVIVNCVAPAVIETPILDGISEEHIGYMVERIPMGRMGEPEEVAALICWLASEECSFSTGATFDISGGRAVY